MDKETLETRHPRFVYNLLLQEGGRELQTMQSIWARQEASSRPTPKLHLVQEGKFWSREY